MRKGRGGCRWLEDKGKVPGHEFGLVLVFVSFELHSSPLYRYEVAARTAVTLELIVRLLAPCANSKSACNYN